MKFPNISFLFIFASFSIFGQNSFDISGIIEENNGNPIAFANVLLLKATDSTLVKGTLSEDNGEFAFANILKGKYFLQGTLLGFQETYSEIFELNSNLTNFNLTMNMGEALNTVIVEATKPLFQQKVDRLVINVASSIVSSGGTALEILERSPGIVVNRQNSNISLIGKEGVVVMINDKISYIPNSALVQMLQGMSADNIESIELITSPPANLDAEGNAGYINIRLKKRTDLGLNGSYSLSYGYGNGDYTNDNTNFNFRNNKINIYGTYSFSIDSRNQIGKAGREYLENGNNLYSLTLSDRDSRQRNHNLRFGLDFQPSDNTILGFLITTFDNRWSMDAINDNEERENGLSTRFVELLNSEINHKKHYGINLNFKHNFTEESFISIDLDYLNYKFNNPTDYTNSFFDGNKVFTNEELLISRKKTPLDTWVGKFDYSKQLDGNLKLEFGAKTVRNNLENDVSIEDLVNGVWVVDPSLTNIAVLEESIYAAYGSGEYSVSEKTNIKFGLRYEFTNTFLETNTDGAVVDREYGEWFPSLFLNRQFNEDLSMSLSYTRRITRPTFDDLAPFVIFMDPNTFISGNSSIQPAFSNSYSYGLNYNSYFLSIQYTYEDESIASFQERIDEGTGRLIMESANLDYIKSLALTLGVPIKISNWWRTQNNINLIKQKARSFYNEEPIEVDLGNFSINSSHSFKVSNKYSMELSGFYNGPSLFGIAELEAQYSINLGAQYRLNDKWGTVKLSVNDILDSMKWEFGTNLPDQNIRTYNTWDMSNRTFMVTWTRNFGNNELKSSRNRETGSEEERRRVN